MSLINFQNKLIRSVLISSFLYLSLLSPEIQSQELDEFYCSDQFCLDFSDCREQNKNCRANSSQSHFPAPDECNCCDYCFDYLNEGDACSTSSLSWPKELCGPGLECRQDPADEIIFTCEKMIVDSSLVNSCIHLRNQYFEDEKNEIVGVAQYLPECDARGRFAPKQCLPGSVCYCANLEGERIFGVGLFSDRMDCACSRDIETVKNLRLGQQSTAKWPHCLRNGDYDQLQCVGTICHCKWDPTNRVRIQLIKTLPCYDGSIHYESYLNPCEEDRYLKEIETWENDDDNRTLIISDKPSCSPDGFYDPIQTRNGKLICVDKWGHQIRNYEALQFSRDAEEMNCFCGIDESILSETATGRTVCKSNGNYRKWQCYGNICFCMDISGKQIVNNIDPIQVHIEDLDQLTACYP